MRPIGSRMLSFGERPPATGGDEMTVADRFNYLRRVASAYVLRKDSQLTFWHENPEVNAAARADELDQYYMTFRQKADYPGPFDGSGVPMLDYHGTIGVQYNPIAVAQYGLANYNLFVNDQEPERKERVLAAADWLVENLRPNSFGVPVWNHLFRWDYRDPLIPPWYSGLAQGQGISLLVRAARISSGKYETTAAAAFESMTKSVDQGGVLFVDDDGDSLIEEYIVSPPTHVLNGFLWGAWGVYDHHLAIRDARASSLWERCVTTLRKNLHRFDTGFWSLYELSGTRLPMVASPFYHRLHIVQLNIMYRLTGIEEFRDIGTRWEEYRRSSLKRKRAFAQKVAFKVLHY